jgi:hypothetical protein
MFEGYLNETRKKGHLTRLTKMLADDFYQLSARHVAMAFQEGFNEGRIQPGKYQEGFADGVKAATTANEDHNAKGCGPYNDDHFCIVCGRPEHICGIDV